MRVLQWLFNSVSGPSVSTATEENKVKSQGKGHWRWGAVVSIYKRQRGTREPGFVFIVVSLVYVVVQDGRAALLHRAENDLFKKRCVYMFERAAYSHSQGFKSNHCDKAAGYLRYLHKVFFGYGAVMHRKCWHGSHMHVPKYLSHLFIVTYLHSQHAG